MSNYNNNNNDDKNNNNNNIFIENFAQILENIKIF